MSKVMLVEDDNNLREIYEARLAAEGYEIISAADGEAALALAIKEKPDLIISDIMMPKVSGFDMLDILRSTTETKGTKIIMMTALNQAEDKAKAESLGADLYLVKSQVTLEDVVRSAKDLLGEETPLSVGGVPVQAPAPMPVQTQPQPANTTPVNDNQTTAINPQPQQITPNPQAPVAEPQQPIPQALPTQQDIASNDASSTANEEKELQQQIQQYINEATTAPLPTPNPQPQQATTSAPTPAPAQTQPQPANTTPATTQPSNSSQLPVADTTPQSTQTTTPVQEPPTSFAQPPSTLQANTPNSDGDPNNDKPAGEQIIKKSDPANQNANQEPGIDASVSGRKKVINPINDVFAPTKSILDIASKDSGPEVNTPEFNTIVTPDGSTLSAAPTPVQTQPQPANTTLDTSQVSQNQQAQVIATPITTQNSQQTDNESPINPPLVNDIIAPNQQQTAQPTPGQPLPPPVA